MTRLYGNRDTRIGIHFAELLVVSGVNRVWWKDEAKSEEMASNNRPAANEMHNLLIFC